MKRTVIVGYDQSPSGDLALAQAGAGERFGGARRSPS